MYTLECTQLFIANNAFQSQTQQPKMLGEIQIPFLTPPQAKENCMCACTHMVVGEECPSPWKKSCIKYQTKKNRRQLPNKQV